ncbi:hypothetical protein ACFC26_16120 [Kitasatospora purpeofusca]|uniref:hypothetical protein n=1 Tax=Kitasatospora purpeofusca TaxID=67352 RepID=UPI0035DC9555
MPGIGLLVDNFDDNTVSPALWPGSYGTYQEAGGRARVACDTGFNAYKSATSWTLTGSSFYLRVYPPAAAGAATATCTAFITSTTAGDDAGFLVDTAGNAMGLYLRSGFADAGAVFLTYSATAHAWLRLRESGGTLYWDTSPDGTTWTNRRTAATPAWAANTDLALYMDSHRDAGTSNWAEYDNLNVPPVTIAPFGTALETGTALSLGRRKTRIAGTATETSTAVAPGRSKARATGTATETDTAVPGAPTKRGALSPAAEVDTVLAPAGRKTGPLSTAVEASTAVPPLVVKARALGHAVETSAAPAPAATKQRVIGTATEIDLPPAPVVAKRAVYGLASEADTGRPPTAAKRAAHGTAVETDTATGPARPHLGHVRAGAPCTGRWAAAAPRHRWITR